MNTNAQSSPRCERISKLSERLEKLQHNLHSEKSTRFDHLEAKVKSIQEAFRKQQALSGDRSAGVRGALAKMGQLVEANGKTLEALSEQKGQELKSLKTRIDRCIEEELFKMRE